MEVEEIRVAIVDAKQADREHIRSLLASEEDSVGTTPPAERHRPNRVIIRSSGRVLFFRPEEIDWLEAAGNYLRVHARGACHPLRVSMKSAEGCLDPWTFLRIHRSAIVNVDRIRELTPWKHGEYVVTMHDGTQLHASRKYSHGLEAFIESYGLGRR